MTPRPPAIAFLARFACIASLASILLALAGCAGVPQEPETEQPSLRSSPLHSLRIADAGPETSAPAGKTTPPRASLPSAESRLPTVEITVPPQLAHTIDLTREPDDLFQRMRYGFSMPDINDDLVLYHQQWYLNRPDYLRRVVERSSRYMHHIIEELEKRGMPTELALLPMVESAYNPMAYSRAKASGLWQFIPSTGKRYNLDQNWWKDDRRDIVASTSAALDYLQSIYEMHGDWHLALASYNWGEGAVGRAINKNRERGLPTDYLSLTMPGETKNYVPKLQALKNIFSDPALLAELNLLEIPNRPYFGTVTQTANIDVKLAAKLAEMSVEEFLTLNPAHNGPVILSETPLVIPADKLDTFMSNLEAYAESDKPLSSWQSYTMRPGDKLEKIAVRFGMTVANLKAVNGIKGQIKVRPGFTLLVAGQQGDTLPALSTLPEQPRLPDADPVPDSRGAGRTHAVRKGETLAAVARRYGTTAAALKRINHLRSDNIAVGARLLVSSAPAKIATGGTKGALKPAKTGAAPVARTSPAKSTQVTRYTVRRGDTVTSIAKRFKVSAGDLLRWNRLSPNALVAGKTLTILLAKNP